MDIFKSLDQLRRDYGKSKLDERNLKEDPLEQFKIWMDEALESDILDPNAMTLATADSTGRPTARIVLLKGYDEHGYTFYTNYESKKAQDIEENPYGCLLFFWDQLERQVRINGKIEKMSYEESEKYFDRREYSSQLGAWASKQSQPLPSRITLLRRVAGLAVKYPKQIPLPPFWGGYRLIPDEYEFWQGRESRLHDRFNYYMENGEWSIQRLYP